MTPANNDNNPPALRALMQAGFDTARKIVLRGEEAMPAFIAEWGDGNIAIYMTPWNGDLDKDRFLALMRLLFAAREVKRYVFIGEAWMVELSQEEGRKLDDLPRASAHPNRIEVLSLIGVEEGRVIGARARLGRNVNGGRTCSGLEWWEDRGNTTGRMTELLPDPSWGPPPAGTAQLLEKKFGIQPKVSSPTKWWH